MVEEMYLEERNQKIIDAVVRKAERVCPGALALIGINGSFMTGDFYEKSDLDLLILVNGDEGRQLACAFIQDDLDVGHDLYCTTWEHLQRDAKYEHPNISKLMDAKIVYCADEKYRRRLDELRQMTKAILAAPFSGEDYAKAERLYKEAEHFYTGAMISEDRSEVLSGAGGVIYYVENAIAMLNKQYFHYGVKRAYEELNAMRNRPEDLCGLIDRCLSASSAESVKENLTALMRETAAVFRRTRETVPEPGKPAAAGGSALAGTYEEMYSNWRNKIHAAAETGDRHLAFMSLVSSNEMFAELGGQADIGEYDTMKAYRPQDLHGTAKAYDSILSDYMKEYKKAGISVRRYSDIDAFSLDYTMN